MSIRQFNLIDQLLIHINRSLNTISGTSSERAHPAAMQPESTTLSDNERKLSAGLMRVNHSGEVCAQALYQGQALTAKSKHVKEQLQKSAEEENDHLAWCEQRLNELKSHTSYLNPLWYIGSFLIGAFAGVWGDRWSLGFIVATEQQVAEHLAKHLQKLPNNDIKSRLIIEQMQEDELHHASVAQSIGAAELPFFVKSLMRQTAKIMTQTAYWI